MGNKTNWLIHKGINFCKTGDLRKIDISSIKRTLDLDAIVLISPLGFSATGEIFFLNSENIIDSCDHA